MPGFAAVGGLGAGEPGVEVWLSCGVQGEVVAGEPVQQCGGAANVLADGDELGVGDLAALGALAESAQQVPDGVAVQQVLLVGVVAACDGVGDPAFQPGHLFVAGRECPDGDQDAAHVSGG